MAMSFEKLLKRAFPGTEFGGIDSVPFIGRLRLAGARVHVAVAPESRLGTEWVSDMLRGVSVMALAEKHQSLEELLEAVRPFARDHHFAVREWAWLAMRPRIVDDPIHAIEVVLPLAASGDAFERRLSLEATRPRSVWGKHIELFKVEPELGAELLEATRCDPDDYVRTAAANWLNDVVRSRPDFVRSRVDQWAACCSYTDAILRRAARNLEPAGEA
jgi:3-methyladenine DNA glycosylase AlkC